MVSPTNPPGNRMIVLESVEEFAAIESAWNRLAATPSLTHEWALAWWRAFAPDGAFAALLVDEHGELRAGASLVRRSSRVVESAANEHTGDWDAIAADDSARAALWRHLATLPATTLRLTGVPGSSRSLSIASEALHDSGFRTAVSRQQLSPFLTLPGSWDELLARVSQNQRSNVRRYRKRLEREGEIAFRTVRGPDLGRELDRFYELEASGWKGAAGTAIIRDASAHRLYTEFARAAAAKGWLRLHLLELDGAPIAAAYGCVLGDAAFLLKSAFDERYRRLAPGTMLRAEALRAAIAEGLSRYEFMGDADQHKLQWGPELRERSLLGAYRGSAVPAYVYRHRIRPLGRTLRDTLRGAAGSRARPREAGGAGSA